jgi:hypothetical protein
MRYIELMEAARKLTPEQVNKQLAELARDPRFAAVVGWLEGNREAWVIEVTKQGRAESHGQIAHAAGSLHAVEILRGQLLQTLEKPKRKAAAGPEEED